MAAWVCLADLLFTDPAKVSAAQLAAHVVAPCHFFDGGAAVRTGPKPLAVPDGELLKSHTLCSLVPPISTLEADSVRAFCTHGPLLAAAWLLYNFPAVGRRTENQLLVLGN